MHLVSQRSVSYPFCWYSMQNYFAQQRNLEGLQVKLTLYGGERISRTGLLYTSFSSTQKFNFEAAPYMAPEGIHLTSETLRKHGHMQPQLNTSETVAYPRSVYVTQIGGEIRFGENVVNKWVSGTKISRLQGEIYNVAMRLLSRRGLQDDLVKEYSAKLNQLQPHLLWQRLVYYHPQINLLMQGQNILLNYYGKLFLRTMASEGIPFLCANDEVIWKGERRLRYRRGKLRILSNLYDSVDGSPKMLSNVCLPKDVVLARETQLAFVNASLLILRNKLRAEQRGSRGFGVLQRMKRKCGRMFWTMPVARYNLPLRSFKRVEGNINKNNLRYVHGVSKFEDLDKIKDAENYHRVFPFLFGFANME